MTEVRSYRRVFDLERRIYSVDRLRLNPGGVPVRGVVYFLALLLGALILAGLPLLGTYARAVPWYVRDLLGPGLAGTILSLLRVDGRTFHLAAQALLRFFMQPRRLDGLRLRSTEGKRWAPGPVTMLPDGSDGRLRRLRYEGPGAVLVMVEHRLSGAQERRLVTVAGRPKVRISALNEATPLQRGTVVSLQRGATLIVHPENKDRRRT